MKPDSKLPPRLAAEEGDDAVRKLLRSAPDPTEPLGLRPRVWNRLEAPALSPWRLRASIALVGVAVAAAVLVVTTSSWAVLKLTSGRVETASASNPWAVGRAGQSLERGAGLRVGVQSTAYVELEGSAVLFNRESLAHLGPGGQGVEISLEKGSVAVRAGKRPADRPFVIRAGEYRVRVVGTVFAVRLRDDAVVEVQTHEGTVEVVGRVTRVLVRAGESWTSDEGLGSRAMDPLEVLVVGGATQGGLDQLAGRFEPQRLGIKLPQTPASDDPSSALELPSADDARAALDRPGADDASAALKRTGADDASAALKRTGADDASAALKRTGADDASAALKRTGANDPSASLARPGADDPSAAPKRSGADDPSASLARPGADDPSEALKRTKGAFPPRLETDPSSAVDRESETYARAKLLAQQRRYAEAAALFQSLTGGESTVAALSRYEVGRLKLRYLEDPRGAAEAFVAYRAHSPEGPLSQEVDLSLIEAHLGSGAFEQAASSIDGFLTRYPQSEKRDHVRLLKAHLARQRGDCGTAMTGYQALESAPGSIGEDALFYAAICEQQTGHPAAARRKLGAYQSRYPAGRHLGEARRLLGEEP